VQRACVQTTNYLNRCSYHLKNSFLDIIRGQEKEKKTFCLQSWQKNEKRRYTNRALGKYNQNEATEKMVRRNISVAKTETREWREEGGGGKEGVAKDIVFSMGSRLFEKFLRHSVCSRPHRKKRLIIFFYQKNRNIQKRKESRGHERFPFSFLIFLIGQIVVGKRWRGKGKRRGP